MYHDIVNDIDKMVLYGIEVLRVESNSIPLVTNKNADTNAVFTTLITLLNTQLQ